MYKLIYKFIYKPLIYKLVETLALENSLCMLILKATQSTFICSNSTT